jgi:Kef-type K+ transport system membrane component KefB
MNIGNVLGNLISDEYMYLFYIAVILMSTKLFGLASRRVHMPAVVGALLAGIVLGPSVFGLVGENDFLEKTAEIGVILLMFMAGLETDLDELKKNGVASFVVATLGVIFPIIFGAGLYYIFYGETVKSDPVGTLKAAFVGVTLTATSVSITVETLREMGKLRGRMGTTILGAAIIDDIMGIVVLTIITSMTDKSVNIGTVMVKILLFFVFIIFSALIVIAIRKVLRVVAQKKRRTSIYVLSFCFIMSFIAEAVFGVADITGAFCGTYVL